jgi:hypothetical protein
VQFNQDSLAIKATPIPANQGSDGFTLTRDVVISGYNRKYLFNKSWDECATKCLDRSWCESSDYYKNTSACSLTDKNAENLGALKTDYADDHHQKK